MQQQQSQILVFSTVMANKAADAVRGGQCASIRDYHINHPLTSSFLQVSNSSSYSTLFTPKLEISE